MRVAIDATPLIGSRTGIGVFVDGLLRSFQDYIPDEAEYEVATYTLSLKARIRGSTHGHWLPLPARGSAFVWRTFGGPKIERFVGDIDVVHGTNFLVPPSKVSRVISVHDLSFLNDSRSDRNSNRRFDHSVKEAVNSGATVHTISEHVAEEIRDKYGAKDVRVVYPGVEQKPAVTKTFPERPTLLAVGATNKRKGFVDLIKAFQSVARQNKMVQLQLVGPAGDSDQEVDQCIKRLPDDIKSRVHRFGFVKKERRDQLMNDATLLVHPSHYEGFGFPVLEAMSMGTPVVTTTGGALPEIAGEAALKVHPGDVDALADTIIELLANEELQKKLSVIGIDRAQMFNWRDTAEGMLDLYTSLL